MRNRIGITYREPEKLAPYVEALVPWGVEPIPLPPGHEYSLTGLSGLLLSGGTDLNPRLYGEDRVPETDNPDDVRDQMELRLLYEALEMDLPVLGICRGMQLINVLHGGTLIQHLDNTESHHHRFAATEHRVLHPVSIDRDTRLSGVCGTTGYTVNSRHHQAICSTGSALVVSARSDDRVIEAIERPDRRFVIGVQWHPEDRVKSISEDRGIFASFVAASKVLNLR